jgi:hypothetical protein
LYRFFRSRGIAERFEPRLRLQLPEGWFAKESLTVLAPDGQANVIASSEPLDPTIDSQRYAQVQGDLLQREFPRFHELAFLPALVFGGRPGYLRHFEWTPPEGERVTQIQLYYAANGRGYTATATTPSSSFARFELDLRRIVAEISLASLS